MAKKKKKAKNDILEDTPVPEKKEKPAKKPKPPKEFSPWPYIIMMLLTVSLSSFSMAGVKMYQNYQDAVYEYEAAVQAQQERQAAQEERQRQADALRASGTQAQPVAAPSPAPDPEPSGESGQQLSGSGAKSNGDGTYTHDFSGGRVLITTASDNNNDPVYHIKDCSSAQKIAPDDVQWFDSEQAAIDAGRRLCGNCNG